MQAIAARAVAWWAVAAEEVATAEAATRVGLAVAAGMVVRMVASMGAGREAVAMEGSQAALGAVPTADGIRVAAIADTGSAAPRSLLRGYGKIRSCAHGPRECPESRRP